jgi:hypothetical protein
VLEGEGEALADGLLLAVVGAPAGDVEAGTVLVFVAGALDFVAGAVLGVSLGDGDWLGECDGLADTLAATAGADVRGTDADIVAVSALAVLVLVVEVIEAALPDGPPPPAELPKMRKAITAMPAKPPTSISPIPRRLCECRSARAPRPASASYASTAGCSAVSPAPASKPSLSRTSRAPRAWELPARVPVPPPSTASETTVGRGFSARRPPRSERSAGETRSPSTGSESGIGSRVCDLGRSEPPTFGIRNVERASCTLESSIPVAPQPGQDSAPLRCLRHVLQ